MQMSWLQRPFISFAPLYSENCLSRTCLGNFHLFIVSGLRWCLLTCVSLRCLSVFREWTFLSPNWALTGGGPFVTVCEQLLLALILWAFTGSAALSTQGNINEVVSVCWLGLWQGLRGWGCCFVVEKGMEKVDKIDKLYVSYYGNPINFRTVAHIHQSRQASTYTVPWFQCVQAVLLITALQELWTAALQLRFVV